VLCFRRKIQSGERRVYGRVRELLRPLVETEIENVIAGKPRSEETSVAASYARIYYEQRCDNNPSKLRALRGTIANKIFIFFFAAFSNSFAMAAWTLYHIMENTNGVGDRVRDEMEKSPGGNVRECAELERCILEIGRLYTPGTVLRKLLKPWTIPLTGTTLCAGATVGMSVYLEGLCHICEST